jgi:nitroreductase
MDKPALTQLDIHPLIKKRWSPRAFLSQPVDKEVLRRIFEAARWAPSSYNEQPWRFIFGEKDDETWEKIFQTLKPSNKLWAALAPVLILSVGKKIVTINNTTNKVYQYDVGQSVAYITFQVMQEGLYIHQMGGFDGDKARDTFEIPEDYQPVTVLAIGYKGEPGILNEEHQKKELAPRQRRQADDFVFSGTFGKKSLLF